MFRCSASQAIPHLKSFAAIPSVSLVLLGHTNRNVLVSHELQRGITLIWALSRPILYYQQGEWRDKNGPVFRKLRDFDVSQAVGIARFESVSESQPNRSQIAPYNATKFHGAVQVLGSDLPAKRNALVGCQVVSALLRASRWFLRR